MVKYITEMQISAGPHRSPLSLFLAKCVKSNIDLRLKGTLRLYSHVFEGLIHCARHGTQTEQQKYHGARSNSDLGVR